MSSATLAAPATAPPVAAETVVETRPEADSHWLPGIEALRGVAALAVVAHHLFDLGGGGDFPGWKIVEGFGEWGVDLFFLLSAFLLSEYFWHPREKRPLRVFWLRRALRIGPAYYACIGILFLFFADRTLLYSHQGLHQLAFNVTFLQWVTPDTSSSLNIDGALWTLTIEMLLYVVMPLLALSMGRWTVRTLVVLVAAGVGWRILVALHGDGLQSWVFGPTGPPVGIARLYLARQFIGFLPLFAVGILARRLVVTRRLPAWATAPVRRTSALLLVALLLPSLLPLLGVVEASDYQHWARFTLYDLSLAVLLAPVLVYAARPSLEPLSALMRAMVWMGKRSYGLYLWHFPVILSVYERGPQMLPPHTGYLWLRIPLILALSIGLAAASYQLIERPAMAYARKVSRRWLAAARDARAGAPAPAG